MQEKQFLTPEELIKRWQDYYGKTLKKSTLNMWRHKNKGPKYKKPLGRVLYPIDEIIKFEQSQLEF